VKLSAHAEQRIAQRDISLTLPERQDLSHALDKLTEKGSNDALLLRSDAAFVVNVPNRTIVTAINQSDLEERIFTQIDSAMLV
jgi:flagellar operon protein